MSLYDEELTQDGLDKIFYNFHTMSGGNGGKSSTKKNFHPTLWGAPAWQFIDYIVLHYPAKPNRQDQVRMINFVMSLGNVLPCEKCRKSYNEFIKAYPPLHNVSSRTHLKRWFDTYKKSH